ncbi:cobalt ABC transporter substrate-binding protein [Pandoraea captiosa]|uniref:Cobalt ABC transporter substrate-binding protein n=1 Tax=Pandoraea captiosa TaxID=2508302 RepID=A0A5E5AN21_9BURK|nr:DUF4198 domain-containing protein [Pandoraea captiosa]VVE74407.1 cobalt ABC transporter substrate-binding protein [Pandoraea captiosa]
MPTTVDNRKTRIARLAGFTLGTLITVAGTAQAHQVWIEQPADQNAVIRFGEFGENLREASPGLLDKFVAPTATLRSAHGEKTAAGTKTANGFTLPFRATAGDALVAEEARYPLFTSRRDGQEVTTWYRPSARLATDFTTQKPQLALDLVPAGKSGEFQLFFQGKPLPKAKVSLVTQSGWAKEAHTNEQGRVTFDMPWKGVYVAEVSHKDMTPGERPGTNGAERYQGVSYVTTTTVTQVEGIDPLPAGPVATPNK